MSIQYPIDLHIHSTVSDGLETPAELYARARREGITALALCDHDTVAGVKVMQDVIRTDEQQNPDRPPLRYLPSIELSTGDGGHAHLLGYGVDVDDSRLLETLDAMQQDRVNRCKRILCLLRKPVLPCGGRAAAPRHGPRPHCPRPDGCGGGEHHAAGL